MWAHRTLTLALMAVSIDSEAGIMSLRTVHGIRHFTPAGLFWRETEPFPAASLSTEGRIQGCIVLGGCPHEPSAVKRRTGAVITGSGGPPTPQLPNMEHA